MIFEEPYELALKIGELKILAKKPPSIVVEGVYEKDIIQITINDNIRIECSNSGIIPLPSPEIEINDNALVKERK